MKKKKFSVNKPKNNANLSIKSLVLSREGDIAITGDHCGRVNLWSLVDGEMIETLVEPHNEKTKVGVCKMALSHSNLFSVIGYMNNTVNVFDNEMGEVVTVFNEHHSPVKHIYVLEDNHRILTTDGVTRCKIWEAHSGQLLESITVDCNFFSLSPDCKYVVSGRGENM